MAKIEIILPAMGEGIIEATITKWLVKEGSMVEEDDPIIEVATDKVDTEIPSPASGKITGIAFKEGDIPKVGDTIAYIENEKVSEVSEKELPKVEKDFLVVKDLSLAIKKNHLETEEIAKEIKSRTPEGKYLSPLVRKIADDEGISHSDLDKIDGSGMDGRITRDDILLYLERVKSEVVAKEVSSSQQKDESAPPPQKVKGLTEAGDEIIEMDRVRKLIADHMVNSKRTSPHVTTFIDVDVTDIINWRNRVKDRFFEKEGMKLTLTPIFFEAVARTLRQFPNINISVDGTNIIRKKSINIGMATALPAGNLIVPVIKKADEKSLIGLTRDVNDLSKRARDNKLKPDEITGGTFTITNYGTVGNLMGTPIINQPQCAILGIGAVKKTPAVIESPSGDSIGIRQILYLSLSYDHRVIDGALGGMFIKAIKDNLESFSTNAYLKDFDL
jgi:2-oxoglutarate dehydrogenase E2 component (dihydrolipoamide succinyltransferase)